MSPNAIRPNYAAGRPSNPLVAAVAAIGLGRIGLAPLPKQTHPPTTTFLWGSYDGRVIFIEPMITKAHIQYTKSVPGNAVVTPLKAPAK